MLKPLTAIAALALMAAPVVALDGPEETVRRVYAQDSLPTTAQGSDALLARDMPAAYMLADVVAMIGTYDLVFGDVDR